MFFYEKIHIKTDVQLLSLLILGYQKIFIMIPHIPRKIDLKFHGNGRHFENLWRIWLFLEIILLNFNLVSWTRLWTLSKFKSNPIHWAQSGRLHLTLLINWNLSQSKIMTSFLLSINQDCADTKMQKHVHTRSYGNISLNIMINILELTWTNLVPRLKWTVLKTDGHVKLNGRLKLDCVLIEFRTVHFRRPGKFWG